MTTRGIAFFDVDGTLIPSMSSGSFLARRLGHQKALDDAEERYAAGEFVEQAYDGVVTGAFEVLADEPARLVKPLLGRSAEGLNAVVAQAMAAMAS